MILLGLDTATRATVAGIWDSVAWTGAELRDDPPPGARPRHTTKLLELALAALERAGHSWDQVDRIAVGVGPGTFTGLRIGVASARALARAREIPLAGVSTLESLALGAAEAGQAEHVGAVLDARRGEVFAAVWARAGAGSLGPVVLAPAALPPEELARRLTELPAAVLAGDGAVEFRQVLERAGAVIPDEDSALHEVSALRHCRLALGAPAGSPELVRPEYLRLPDAEIALRASQST